MISVRNLTKVFDEFVAVDNVSFEIREGETFALLGPNGSGKSTTLRCMVGLAIPSSGEIAIHGFDVWKQLKEARRYFSYLPQRVNFQDNLTAREILEFYCRLRKISEKRIDELLNNSRFEFDGFADRRVGEFSGGMVQRLGLAVACLADAPVLILDEPTVSLDPEGAIQFREFLTVLKKQGKTIIFATHMLTDVEQLADRVAIFVGGKIVALESTEELREGLAQSWKMRVVMEAVYPKLVVAAQEAGAEKVVTLDDTLLITSHPDHRLKILHAIESAGGHVIRFATEEVALEDIYVRYIHEKQIH